MVEMMKSVCRAQASTASVGGDGACRLLQTRYNGVL